MPEAAMDENDLSACRQHDVWAPRKVASVKAESEALCMQKSPDS
jgi:hypothetical protein